MLDIQVLAVIAVTVPAIRLLLALAPSFIADSPALGRERHAFLGMLAAVAVVTYGWAASSDKVMLSMAWLNLGSSLCMYYRACLDTADEMNSYSSAMSTLIRNREKQDGED